MNKISELEEKGDVKGLEAVKEEAEASFEGDIAGLAEQAIARLNAKAESARTTSHSQVSQVESMGGSVDEAEKRTASIDAEIDKVKTEAGIKVAEAKDQTSTKKEGQEPMIDEGLDSMVETFLRGADREYRDLYRSLKVLEDRRDKLAIGDPERIKIEQEVENLKKKKEESSQKRTEALHAIQLEYKKKYGVDVVRNPELRWDYMFKRAEEKINPKED